jgi:sugar phosphate isomerase/epimerase
MKHEVGCSTLGWHFYDLDAALTGIASLGFQCIDIAMIPGICSHFDPVVATPAEKEALKKRVREAKFRVATLNTFKGFLGDSADRETALGFLRECLALAKEMGAYGLCIQSGTPRAAADWQKAAMALAADLRLLGEAAAPLGLDIGVEVHREMLISSSHEALELMKMVNHPRIGITLDPCHVTYGGENPAAVARALGPWVRHVHLRDAIGKNTEVVPGEGTVDFAAFVAALDEIGYARPMMVELEYPAPAPTLATICKDAEKARALMKRIFTNG